MRLIGFLLGQAVLMALLVVGMIPRDAAAHMVVFPHMPTVITVPLPPLAPDAIVETGAQVAQAGDQP